MKLQEALYEMWSKPDQPGSQRFVATTRGEDFIVLCIADAAWEEGWVYDEADEQREAEDA